MRYNYTTTTDSTQVSTETVAGPTSTLTTTSTQLVTSTVTTTEFTNGTVSPLSVYAMANTTIPGNPDEIGFDDGKIFVADAFQNELTIVNETDGSIIGAITLPGSVASQIVGDPDTGVVYVGVDGCINVYGFRTVVSAASHSL